jgi:uncharacterized protein (DUF427 family)
MIKMIQTKRIDVRPATGNWVIRAGGAVIGESARALELHENGHDPVIYFPRDDLGMAFLEPSPTRTHCPFKGEATYWNIVGKSVTIHDAGWSYHAPKGDASAIAGYIAFYPDRVTLEEI